MRKALVLFGLICCIADFSCSEKCCAPPVTSGFSATKNGSEWQVFNGNGQLKQDTLTISDTTIVPDHSEALKFKLKFNGKVNYTLTADNIAYGYVLQMDNPYVHYTLDPDYANTFSVTFYDAAAGYVAGSFNIKLDKDPSNPDTRYPPTVTFLNGSFSIHLSK